MKRPIAVKKLTTFMAIPSVSVGRIIEQTGSDVLRKWQGSGMIKFVWKFCPPKGGLFRSGKTNPLVGSVRGGAFPALSAQVWKCIVSVGPMLIRILRTSTLLARCAIEGYRLLP